MSTIKKLNLKDSVKSGIVDLRNVDNINEIKLGSDYYEATGQGSVALDNPSNNTNLTTLKIYGNSEIDGILNKYGSYVIDPINKIYTKLDPTDHNKFSDGTIWNGTYGEAFRRFPKVYYKVITRDDGKSVLGVSTKPISDFSWDEAWIGTYKGNVGSDNKLHSRPNVAATGSKTMSQFWDYARANDVNFGLVDYFHQCELVALHLITFGNADSSKTMGKGLQDAGSAYFNSITGKTASLGDGTGEAPFDDKWNQNKLFGIEGLTGQQLEFRPNIKFKDDKAYIYSGNIVSNTITEDSSEWIRTIPRLTSSGYQKALLKGDTFDIMPLELSGSTTTYYCDYYYGTNTGELLLVGGSSADGPACGLSYLHSGSGFSYAYTACGARLAFKGNIDEYRFVSGKEMAEINSVS